MNPNYGLRIETTIGMHKAHRDITLVFERYIDIIPYEGMKLRFVNDDADTMEVEFVNLVYDYNNKIFIEAQLDNSLIDAVRESAGPECTVSRESLENYVNWYKSFGWK